MRRIGVFLIVAILSIVSLVAVIGAAYFVLTSSSAFSSNRLQNMWSGIMGGGMMSGNGDATPAQNNVAPYFGVVFVILVAIALIGIVGVIYFAMFPEIRNSRAVAPQFANVGAHLFAAAQSSDVVGSPYESVLKTLNSNESKVIQVLSAHDGKYLQKYIRNEAGLSRLQTHRVVARLAERGIVTLEKTGNTNTVLLANWLK
jgi:predicted transcriptional regulator